MRTKRKRFSPARAATAELLPAAPAAFIGSGYQAAWSTGDRGYVQWPTIDTRQELDSFSRYEIIRRIHFLKAHFGFLAGVINSTADLVGWETPQAASADEAWNKQAEERFWDVVYEAAAFDVAGKFGFEEAQPMLIRCALTDAQVFTVLTKWQDGTARVAFYEASQLTSPPNAGDDWVDGIQIAAKTRRHIAYGFRDGTTERVVVVPARFVIHFGEFDSPGQDMPVPPLAHAVNHALDIQEVWGFVKKALKVSSLSGAVIERDANAATPRGKQGMPGASTTVTNSAGEKFQQANVWDGGQINALDPGSKVKILHDSRPAPEQRQFVQDLKRDIAQGFRMPVEIFDDMGNLTGPGVRFVMDFAGNSIKQRRKRLRVWSRKIWRYVIACEIAKGTLTAMKDWWEVTHTSQRLLTVDRGKDSKARLDELDGPGCLADWEEFDGRDWRSRIDQKITEAAYKQAKCDENGLDYAKVFPPRAGTAPAPAAAETPADDRTTPDPEKP